MLKLFKSDASLGRSILQIDSFDPAKPIDRDGPDNIIQIADELNLSQVILVEDNLGEFIKTYKELKKHNRSLIFGWRVSFVSDATDLSDQPSHKNIIFIKSEAGWKKVIKLATAAQTKYFHKEPRLDYNILHQFWGDELVLAVPFYDSFIYKNLVTKETCVPDFRGIKPVFFVEDNDHILDNVIKKGLDDYIAANDGDVIRAKTIYYRNREDCYIFQARRLMERKVFRNSNCEEPNMEFFCSEEFCLEAALEQDQTVSAAEENFLSLFNEPLSLFLPGIRLPEFQMPEEERKRYNVPQNASNDEVLRLLAREGFKQKVAEGQIPKDQIEKYGKQADYELKSLSELHFTDYILLVWRCCAFAKRNNLPMGLGRGSCCSSVILWLIGCTGVNPIKYDLYFERFINPSRSKSVEATDPATGLTQLYISGSVPDADLDCSIETRDRIVEYLHKIYPDKVCKLGTFSTYTTKAITKDCAKVIGGYAEEDIRAISDEVPVIFGRVHSPLATYEESEKFRAFMDENPKVWRAIRKLHECKKAMGVHPSAFIIADKPLNETFPLGYSSEGSLMAVVDMTTSESIAIKLDLLGLDGVSLIFDTMKMAGIELKDFDFDDPEIYKPFQKLEHPVGIPQLSSPSGVASCNLVKPKSLPEVAGLLSVIRPGSLAYLQQYADYLNGKSEAISLHPSFDEILKPTGGVLLFQEQILRILSDVFGFSLANAENVRKCLGKKNAEEMATWESKVYEQAKLKGLDTKAADVLWSLLKSAADYSFNKSLSPLTLVHTESGPVHMQDVKIGDKILAYNEEGQFNHYVTVSDIVRHKAILWYVEFNDRSIICSMEHKFLTKNGMVALKDILWDNLDVLSIDGKSEVRCVSKIGEVDAIDFEVNHKDHNFLANGLVTSNSHALAYSCNSVLGVYLKTRKSPYFYLQALRLCKGKPKSTDEIAQIARELPYFNIKLLPPDLIKSDSDFKLEDGNIRFGLSSIKSVAEKSIDKIKLFISQDTSNLFEMFQSARQAKINTTVFIALIETGALDSFSEDRQHTTLCWRVFGKMTEKERQYCLKNGQKYDYNLISCLKDYLEWSDTSGKKIGKASRLETLRRDCEPYFKIYKENMKHPNLSEYLHEKFLLGFSSHKLRELFVEYPYLQSVDDVKNKLYEKDKVNLVGEVLDVHISTTKKTGKKYCRLEIADETGVINVGLFGEKWEKYKERYPDPEEGQIMYITGQKGADIIWGDSVTGLRLDVYMRTRDLRKLEKKEIKEEVS